MTQAHCGSLAGDNTGNGTKGQNRPDQATQSAGIQKKISVHVLRHRFATPLLEKAIDLRYSKDLLGHFSITTTERYLQVKKEELITIINPLDALYAGKSWEGYVVLTKQLNTKNESNR